MTAPLFPPLNNKNKKCAKEETLKVLFRDNSMDAHETIAWKKDSKTMKGVS